MSNLRRWTISNELLNSMDEFSWKTPVNFCELMWLSRRNLTVEASTSAARLGRVEAEAEVVASRDAPMAVGATMMADMARGAVTMTEEAEEDKVAEVTSTVSPPKILLANLQKSSPPGYTARNRIA